RVLLGVGGRVGRAEAAQVGHDWGAALAWAIAALAPDRVDHLAVLSVGHPSSFGGAGLAQREKSWYMLLFQFQGVAEQWLSNDDWANFVAWAGHPDPDTVKAEQGRPGRLTAGLNWYRANIPPESLLGAPLDLPPVAAPTMGIWSSGDIFLTEAQMTGSTAFVSGPWRYERLDGVGHWLQLEAPEVVNALLLDFLGQHRDRGSSRHADLGAVAAGGG
ncbi:MAG: alpha/beta fold hydrolase, partial [Ilumatobacteraceae bacterium]